jgi:type IV pilus assembly protein PilY1
VFLDAEPAGIGGVLSGQPTIVDSDGNGYVDRVYIGSDKGYMYKINIPDSPKAVNYAISHCVINTDFSDDFANEIDEAQRYHPIYGSPVAVMQNSLNTDGSIDYNVLLFFSTGDSPYYDEDINTADTTYHFFAYRDKNGKGECDDSSVGLDWFYELPPGHRIWASAFAAAGNIYFGTSTAETEDPCEGALDAGSGSGELGRIYAFDLSGVQKFEKEVGNVVVSPLVEDEHLYVQSQTGGIDSYGSASYNNKVQLGGTPQVIVQLWRELF